MTLATRLLSLTVVACLLGDTLCATTINFAMLWNEEGMSSTTQRLFNQIFLPQLRNSCLSAPDINSTAFNFIDAPQVGLFDFRLADQQINQLQRSGCLFAGAYDQSELPLFSQASIPSGVTGFPGMQVHVVAPLTIATAQEGVNKALTEALKLPSSGMVDTKLCIVLGSGYSMDQLQSVVDRYPGSEHFYQLRMGNENVIVNLMKASGATNFLLASPTEEADRLLAAAYSSLLLSPPYRWFLFNVPTEVNQTFSGMTGEFQLNPNGSVVRTDWRMHFYSGLGSERQRIGNWTSSGLFNFERQPDRVPNEATVIRELNKNLFRVVTILKPPFVQYKKGYENRTDVELYDALEGFTIDLCKEILTNMSINDISFFLQPDGQYGVQDSQGNWDGIMQTMMQGKADLACASLSETDARRQVMKFSQPYLSFQLSILYAKRLENPLSSMFQFMRPFHMYTWLAVIGSVVCLSIVLTVLHRLSRNAASFGIYETIFFSFASLIQGITGTPPDRPSGQLVIAIYWLFAFVVLVAYVTNYAASRTLSRLQSEITSLATLHSQNLYVYGTVAGTSYLIMFQNSTDSIQQQIYRYMTDNRASSLLPNLTLALDLVKNGTYALIYDSAMNQYYSQFICNAVNTGAFSTQSASLGLPRTAEYSGIIEAAITQLINSGWRDKLYKKYFTLDPRELPNCRSTIFPDLLRDYIPDDPAVFNTKSGALTLNNTLGIAVINLVGCVLTLLLATVEFGYLRCKRWRQRRKQRMEQKRAEMTAMPKLTSDADQMESTA